MKNLLKTIFAICSIGLFLYGVSNVYFAVHRPKSAILNPKDIKLGADIPKHLKLKAPKEKILAHREKTIYHKKEVEIPLLGTEMLGTSSTEPTPEPETPTTTIVYEPEVVIEYDYISDITTDKKLYFSNGRSFSNAEYLPERNDGKEPLAFYSEDQWVKQGNNVFVIAKGATTTPDAFLQQTSLTLFEKIRKMFSPTALAVDVYNSSTTWTPSNTGVIEILLVAGGGGGGYGFYGGGGGGGGLIYDAEHAVTVQEYTITVGGGGTGGTDAYTSATNGGNSVFDTFTAVGGGGGASRNTGNGSNGGSGGGCAQDVATGGTGTGGQGYDGGDCASGQLGASGGGAGAVGGDGEDVNTSNNAGGVGLEYSISGSAVYYAGGGGGGRNEIDVVLGGNGGGGNGGRRNPDTAPTAGTTNKGGGGGGGGAGTGAAAVGADGGSGVIIIVFTADPVVFKPKNVQVQLLDN